MSDFTDKVLRVGLGSGLGLGMRSKVLFWAVFDIFRLIILEAYVGQTNFSNFYTLSYIIIQNCGEGGSYLRCLCIAYGSLFEWCVWISLYHYHYHSLWQRCYAGSCTLCVKTTLLRGVFVVAIS